MDQTLSINVETKRRGTDAFAEYAESTQRFQRRMDGALQSLATMQKGSDGVRSSVASWAVGASAAKNGFDGLRSVISSLASGNASVPSIADAFKSMVTAGQGMYSANKAFSETVTQLAAMKTHLRESLTGLRDYVREYRAASLNGGSRGLGLVAGATAFGIGAHLGMGVAEQVTDNSIGQYAIAGTIGAAGYGVGVAGKAALTSSWFSSAVTSVTSLGAAALAKIAAAGTAAVAAIGAVSVLGSQSVADWAGSFLSGPRETGSALERALARNQRSRALATALAPTGFAAGEIDGVVQQQQERARNRPIRALEEQRDQMLFDGEMLRPTLYTSLIARASQTQRDEFGLSREAFMRNGGGLRLADFATLQQAQADLQTVVGQDNPMFRMQRQTIDRRLNGVASDADRMHAGLRGLQAANASGNLDAERTIRQGLGMGDLSTAQAIEATTQRLVELSQQRMDLERQRDRLNQSERQHNVQILEQQRAIHRETEQFARQQAETLRQQQRGDEVRFGLSDDESRNRSVNVGRRLQAFFQGAGRDDFTREDLGIAQGTPQLQRFVEELARRRAQADPRFRELEGFTFPGELTRPQRIAEFERIGNQNRELGIKLENQIRATITADVNATATELAERLQPVFGQMLDAVTQQIQMQFNLQEAVRIKNQFMAQAADPTNQK